MFSNSKETMIDLWSISSYLSLSIITAFILFWDLNSESLSKADEAVHIRVAQEMQLNQTWLKPTLLGEAYLHKPPLSFWLSAAGAKIFGQSKWAYRFFHAVCGALLIFLIMLWGKNLSSTTGGLLAACSLLGCTAIFRYHGLRSAVPDSSMLLFTTLALFYFWRAAQNEQSPTHLLILSAVCSAIAFLSKSLFGFIPLVVIAGVYLLPNWRRSIQQFGLMKLLLIFGILIASITSVYLIPGILFREGGFEVLVQHEIFDRALIPLHQDRQMTYYIQKLFGGEFFPIELIIISIGGLFISKVKDKDLQFLIVWFLLLFIGISFFRTRLLHYLYPTLIPLALLLGLAGSRLVKLATSLTAGHRIFYQILVLLFFIGITRGIYSTASYVFNPKTKDKFDSKFIELKDKLNQNPELTIYWHKKIKLPLNRLAYRGILETNLQKIKTSEEIISLMKANSNSIGIMLCNNQSKLLNWKTTRIQPNGVQPEICIYTCGH
ncbi:MAG: glycosyltransferase family 39 protein [Bdellovibrionota bacterium]